ncbi:MAG: ERF family protein [Candidatus Nanopelagicaceae bacterium]
MTTLPKLQAALKVPKNRLNSFSKFKYRNLEDIMEGVKPHLVEHGLTLTLTDDLVQIGDRYYIKATARISDGKTEQVTTAFAREPEIKKGMDEPQITGTASSYARKYALAGLLLLDDAEDIDSMDNREEPRKSPSKSPRESDDKIWLDEGGDGVKGTTRETFIKVEEAVKSGRVKPADLRKHYKVSKQTMQYFESMVQ